MRDQFLLQIEADGRISTTADDFLTMTEMFAEVRKGRLGPADPDADTLSPYQVSIKLGIARSTVDRMANDGSLPGVIHFRQGKRKGLYGVNRKVLEQWMEGRSRKK